MVNTEDPYAQVSKGKLKLKSDSVVKKKKKKKDKKILEQVIKTVETESTKVVESNSNSNKKKTKAEQAYKKMQEKMVSIVEIL